MDFCTSEKSTSLATKKPVILILLSASRFSRDSSVFLSASKMFGLSWALATQGFLLSLKLVGLRGTQLSLQK